MKCLLHIGTEKTGTTLLQDWLYDNQEHLSTLGVYLSDNLGKTNNRLLVAYFQSYLDDWAKRNGIGDEIEKERYFDGFLDKLRSEIALASVTHDIFIITSEHFHSRFRQRNDIERLWSFLMTVFDEVEVVCYFRDQFDVAVSLYSTQLTTSTCEDIEAVVEQAKPENYYYNYLLIADNWAEVFGRGNCRFRIYDRKRFVGNDIRLDFLNLIREGIDTANFNMERQSSNESLTLLQSVGYKVVNKTIPYWHSDHLGMNLINWRAKVQLSKLDSLKLGKLTSKKQELIRDRFRDSNSALIEKYFDVGDKFPESQTAKASDITTEQALAALEDAFKFDLEFHKSGIGENSLSDGEIDVLRDVALKLSEANPDMLSDALALMKIALHYRPKGPLIKQKVDEWSAFLGLDDTHNLKRRKDLN